jgi:hypothetical protein
VEIFTATTEGILALAKDAEEDKQTGTPRNRSAYVEVLEEVLDPGGVHVCKMMLPHEHVGGVRVTPHLRTWWIIAVKKKKNGGGDLWLDVSMEAFEQNTKKETIDGREETCP